MMSKCHNVGQEAIDNFNQVNGHRKTQRHFLIYTIVLLYYSGTYDTVFSFNNNKGVCTFLRRSCLLICQSSECVLGQIKNRFFYYFPVVSFSLEFFGTEVAQLCLIFTQYLYSRIMGMVVSSPDYSLCLEDGYS